MMSKKGKFTKLMIISVGSVLIASLTVGCNSKDTNNEDVKVTSEVETTEVIVTEAEDVTSENITENKGDEIVVNIDNIKSSSFDNISVDNKSSDIGSKLSYEFNNVNDCAVTVIDAVWYLNGIELERSVISTYVEATPESTVKGEVQVSGVTLKKGDKLGVKYTVSDSDTGLPMEELEDVFIIDDVKE